MGASARCRHAATGAADTGGTSAAGAWQIVAAAGESWWEEEQL